MKIREVLKYALHGMQWSALAICLVAMFRNELHAFQPLLITLISGALISVGFLVLNSWDRLPPYAVFALHYVWTATVSFVAGLLSYRTHLSIHLFLNSWRNTLVIYIVFVGSIFLYALAAQWYRRRQQRLLADLNQRNHERQRLLDEKDN
ncbi:hypothetical protein [Furfurilactobacillus siliginis]|uniref:Uncharacterized protein n=1 Tax=Furfurilactobacillus siliginis TaxID=348151 RepID=A0A0R2L6Q4_9LACO|nr:hypothetical protein [Furfurilactobacillus siliginis]KRN97121.1 hypothetical protein IV55_GL000034 [Furfurilactobacillus siliginis]GEK29627.1 hypothetical protein LSI01_19380 [Furfurilactobacillus siliginis]